MTSVISPSDTKCIYCNIYEADTVDHVPPECFFPKSKPSNLITVPCCKSCNSEFGRDDEFVKTSISLIIDSQQSPLKQAIIDSSIRGLSRREAPGFRASVFRKVQHVMFKPEGGIYQPTFAVALERRRFVDFGIRVAKGLYYKEMGCRIPAETICSAEVNEIPHDPERIILKELLALPSKIIQNKIFEYKNYINHDDPSVSAWLLSFFQCFFIGCLTVPRPAVRGTDQV